MSSVFRVPAGSVNTMLNPPDNNATGNFFKSINIRLDIAHPERFAHFHPTTRNTRIIRAVVLGEPSLASTIVASYGSGKSLAAGAAAMLLRNDKASNSILCEITERIALVDRELGEILKKRTRFAARGLSIVLEGYEPDISGEIFRQAKEKFSSLRRPRNHRGNMLKTLETIWAKAREKDCDYIAILWDEFGRHLEAHNASGNTEELLLVQQISEWTSRKRFPGVTFTLILHQAFLRYADNLSQSTRAEWKKIEGRFGTVHYVEDSREIYELIASVVRQLRGGVEQNGSPRKFEKRAEKLLKLGLFKAFDDRNALAETLANASPLNPLTLYSLPRLAARLAQNERTVFSFVRDIPLDKTVTFGDLYGYFSDSMSMDTGVGGIHRRWLEIESALSKANNETEKEILSSAAILGFGVSGERARVKKSLLEFAVSDFRGLLESDISKTIEGLIDRKLLLYRERNDDISVWHGTDMDIRGHLAEEIQRIESEFKAIDVLSKEYPALSWRPVAHNVKNAIRRFFEGRYVSAGELLKKGFSHPLFSLARGEDGRIIYCIAENHTEISDLLSFVCSTSSVDPGVVFVIPRRPVRILDLALEIMALGRLQRNHDIIAADPFVLPELRYMADFAREDMSRLMKHIVRPGKDRAHWFSEGELLLAENEWELSKKLSEIADKRFSSTPRINNELIVRKKISRPMTNARKKLILGILERSGEPCLGFERNSTTPDVAMYRTVLERTGLYGFYENKWRWAVPEQLEDRNLAEVWRILRQFFEVPGLGKSPSKELFRKLELPPYGMRMGVMPILVAAALQAFGRTVLIKREDKYIADILASEIEEFCSTPEKFTLDVLELDTVLSRYLIELIEQFDARQPATDGDLIRQFYDSLEFWKSQLPDQALKTRLVSDETRLFQRILRKETDPGVVALREFPKLAGVEKPDEKTSKFISKLRCEIENIVDGYTEKAIFSAREVFNIMDVEGGNVLNLAKSWSMCFDEEASAFSNLDNACRAVLSRAREATESRYTESSFVLALAYILLGKGFDQWNDSNPQEFADCLRENVAKLELAALGSAKPSKLFLPLLNGYFHRLYGQFERMLGSQSAVEKMKELLEEKEEAYTDSFQGFEENGTYGKST